MNPLFDLIGFISLLIGLFGIIVILIGAYKAIRRYIENPGCEKFEGVRFLLARHLVVGLDFLVAKDVIDTFLLHTGDQFWHDLAALIVVVAVRIVLTHFMIKEMEDSSHVEKTSQKTKKKK